VSSGFLEKAAAASAVNVRDWQNRFGTNPERGEFERPVFLPAEDDGCTVIAEIKMASPSRGDLMGDRDPLMLPAAYQSAGAGAISVVVEEQHFGGSPELFSRVRALNTLPMLWKDFVIDPYQVALASALGASGVLLIAGMLGDERLVEFLALARADDLKPLVEVHDELELERALSAGAELVGVNNRDLVSLEVDLSVSERLAILFSPEVQAVSESGMKDAATVNRMKSLGYTAVLVGEALVTAGDPAQVLGEMTRAGR
jgi:indole-3-glycerol phosphate synthase